MDALIDGMKVPTYLLDNLYETDLNKSNKLDLEFALEKDGYIFLRNIIDEKKIKQAREDIFKKLNEVDELSNPFTEGIASGNSNRDKLFNDRGDFWKNVSAIKSLRRVTNGKKLENIFTRIFKTPSVGFDFIFVMAVAGGKFTHMHCDAGFFTRKTHKVLTCWLVFTEVHNISTRIHHRKRAFFGFGRIVPAVNKVHEELHIRVHCAGAIHEGMHQAVHLRNSIATHHTNHI